MPGAGSLKKPVPGTDRSDAVDAAMPSLDPPGIAAAMPSPPRRQRRSSRHRRIERRHRRYRQTRKSAVIHFRKGILDIVSRNYRGAFYILAFCGFSVIYI
jgi:hypothetical protein